MLSKRINVIFLLISSIMVLSAIDAQSQTLASARVLSSDGPVEIQRRAQGQAALMKIAYRVDDELVAGDVIKTFKGGRLVLGLMDGSQAIISEKTTVEIVDLSQSPRTIFNLLRGKTRIKIEKVGGRPNPYRVNTPTAVIAVRGTLFDVLVTDMETQVFVHEGEVAVSNLVSPQAFVILSPGQRTRVQEARPPQSPSNFRPGRNNDTFKPHPSDKGPNVGPRGESSANRPSANQRVEPDRRRQQPEQSPSDANGHTQRQPGVDSGRSAIPTGDSSPAGQRSGGSRPPERFFPDID
jgi:hypothetical protein